MPSSHVILCRPLLLLPPIPLSIKLFSNESTLPRRWLKYWSFSFSNIPSKEIPGLISFRMDWLDLLAVQGTLERPLYDSLKTTNKINSWVLTIWPLPLLSYFSWALPPPMELTLQLDTLSPVPTTCLFAKYLLLITSQPWVPSLINHTNSATLCQALLGLLRISEQWYCRSQDFRDGILIKSLLQPFVLFITELLFQFQLAHWYSNF